jgi:serine/threonine protein kinase
MLEAVHSVHQERIVHSDLKPANFLSVLGELKLIDFGIAKVMVSESTCIVRKDQVRHVPAWNCVREFLECMLLGLRGAMYIWLRLA